LRRILAEQFPDETLEKISAAQDLEHSLSKIYTRGILQHGSAQRCLSGRLRKAKSQDALESSLTYGLLWLEKIPASPQKRAALATLRLILPKRKIPRFLGQSSLGAAGIPRSLALNEIYGARCAAGKPWSASIPCSSGNVCLLACAHRESQLLPGPRVIRSGAH